MDASTVNTEADLLTVPQEVLESNQPKPLVAETFLYAPEMIRVIAVPSPDSLSEP